MSDDDGAPQGVDQAIERLTRFERSLTRLRWALVGLVLVAGIAVSGWWATARDRDATIRNGLAADCRGAELAHTLDLFQVIVSPRADDDAKARAGDELATLPTLRARYRECTSS